MIIYLFHSMLYLIERKREYDASLQSAIVNFSHISFMSIKVIQWDDYMII